MSNELIKTAKRILGAARRKPSQADLPRAISTTYYAMFDVLARNCAEEIVGRSPAKQSTAEWARVYRALEHGRSKSAGDAKVITGVCNAPGGRRVPHRLYLRIKEGFDTLRGATTANEREAALRTLVGRLHAAGQIEPVFSERARTLGAQFRAAAALAKEEAVNLVTAA